jgi:thiol-disulfide isomerase/thioredoxin
MFLKHYSLMTLKTLRTTLAAFFVVAAWALISAIPAAASDGYSIKVKFTNLKDTTVILGHHFSKSIYPDDTVRLDSKGVGVFEGKKKLPHGLYIIFVPSKGNYFDIMLDDDQSFTLKIDTSDYQKYTKVRGSKVNKDFFKYQLYLTSKRDQVNKLNELKKNTAGSRADSITNAITAIDKDVKKFVEGMIKRHKSDFMGRFLTSMKEVEVPEAPKDVKDTLFKYHYYRNHYFDYFKLSDPDLLRTPFYETKMLTYLDKVIPQMPDSIYPEVDKVIESSRTTPELFRYVLVSLFNHYAQSNLMGMDAVTIHIAEKYYIPEATWSDSTFINKLKKQIKVNKPLLIGKQAPDIRLVQVPDEHFIAAANDSVLQHNVYVGNFFNLRQTAAEYTVICFWEADCSHCKKAVPELYNVYQKLKNKGVQVIAVNLLFGEEGKVKWIDFVNKNKLYGWINAWNPYDYSFKEIYDVTSTPVIYLFDSEMKIVAKRIGPEQIEEIINVLSKSKKK